MANDLNIVYKISADITGLKDGVDRAAKSAEGLESAANRIQGAIAGAFTVTALVSFGKALINDADALVKMSDRTGASIQGLQKLQVAGDDAGNTIEQMTGAINQMQNRLAQGDDSAVGGLKALGLSLDAIRAMKPDDAFIAISDAIRDVADPTEQTRIAMELFGKSGAEILPTLKRGFDDLKGASVGMSEETVRALDDAGDALARYARQGKGLATEVLVAVVQAFDPFSLALEKGGKAADDAAKHLKELGDETKHQIKAVEDLAAALAGEIGPQEDASTHARIYADLLRKQEKAKQDAQDALEKARDALKKWNDTVEDSTIKMNLSVFTLNRYGAVTLPAVTSSLQDVRDQLEGWLEPLDSVAVGVKLTADQLEGLQRAGQFATVAMDALNKQLLTLPNVHSSLDGVDTEIHSSADALGELAKAFGVVGQVSGGSMGAVVQEIGKAITAINLAQKATDELAKATTTNFAQMAGAVASYVSALFVIKDVLLQIPTFGTTPTDRVIKQIQEAVDKAKALQDALASAAQHTADLLAEASRLFGPSQTDLDNTEKHLHEIFDAMTKAGTYSADQLNAAYYAWQKALADAGNEAAKAWVKQHDAAATGAAAVNAEVQKLIDKRDELTKSISQEAPEAVMGAIEQQQRAERDALDVQIKNAQDAADAAAAAQSDAAEITKEKWGDTSDVLKGDLSSAGDEAADHIKNAFDFTIHIPIVFDTPDLPFKAMATGGIGTVTQPTLFLAGEAGPEQYAFSGANRTFDGAGSAGGPIVVQVLLDGQVVAENTVTKMAQDKRGLRTKTRRALGVS